MPSRRVRNNDSDSSAVRRHASSKNRIRQRKHAQRYASSGSSEESVLDSEDGREVNNEQRLTHSEEKHLRKSVTKKVLGTDEDEVGISRLQKYLHRADREGKGRLDRRTFEECLSRAGLHLSREELSWLTRSLRSPRHAGSIEYANLTRVLRGEKIRRKDRDDDQYAADSGHSPSRKPTPSHRHRQRRRTSSSDSDSVYDRSRSTDSDSWKIRRGSVGSWLEDVASPMERKLFHDFIKCMDKFEHKNGLDHYRYGTPEQEADGATVIHLGPTLKASIKFFV